MTNFHHSGDLNTTDIRAFWEERARRFQGQDLINVSNLEADAKLACKKHTEEQKVLLNYLNLQREQVVLDLGAGHCAWSVVISKFVKHVDAVEYSKGMIELAKENILKNKIKNISLYHCDAQTFETNRYYDAVLISGLLIYLSDADLASLLTRIHYYLRQGGRVVVRDGTGKEKPFSIINRYSDELKSDYSAYYRTSKQYIYWFKRYGFSLLRHQDMFPDGSPFNKRKETILRIYEFYK